MTDHRHLRWAAECLALMPAYPQSVDASTLLRYTIKWQVTAYGLLWLAGREKYGGVPVTICVVTAADSDIRSTVVVVLPIMSTSRYASSTIKKNKQPGSR